MRGDAQVLEVKHSHRSCQVSGHLFVAHVEDFSSLATLCICLSSLTIAEECSTTFSNLPLLVFGKTSTAVSPRCAKKTLLQVNCSDSEMRSRPNKHSMSAAPASGWAAKTAMQRPRAKVKSNAVAWTGGVSACQMLSTFHDSRNLS